MVGSGEVRDEKETCYLPYRLDPRSAHSVAYSPLLPVLLGLIIYISLTIPIDIIRSNR